MDKQLKLLNFHKMLANFANNLVGAFMILIVYQYTGQLWVSMVYGISTHIIRLIFEISLQKAYSKYPQLMLLIRVIPIVTYNVLVILLEIGISVPVCIVGICIFQALDYALNNISKEVIFNYSSLNKGGGSLGMTRVFEQIGVVVALILGGALLDLNKIIVVSISITIYLISVIPLVGYYIKSRKSKSFNKDAISNAVTVLDKKQNANTSSTALSKQMLLTYAIVYFGFAFLDLLTGTFNLSVYISQGSFTTAGILSAIFNVVYMVGSYVAGKYNEEKDLTIFVSVCCFIIGFAVIGLPFLADKLDSLFFVVCIIYFIIGALYPFISIFVLERMLSKTRIVGCSNSALICREYGCVVAYSTGYALGFISLPAIFIAITISMMLSAFLIPTCEEITRQSLVDYLQNNEITHRRTRKPKVTKNTIDKSTKDTSTDGTTKESDVDSAEKKEGSLRIKSKKD